MRRRLRPILASVLAFEYRPGDMIDGYRLWWMILVVALGACSRPRPPTLTPQVTRVVAVSATGIDLEVEVRVDNPNSIPLMAEAVRGTLFVAEGQKLAHGSARPAHSIPARGSSVVQSRLHAAWEDLMSLTPFLAQESLPYVLKGDVTMGGESFNITLPFSISGHLTRTQLLQAGLRGL